MDLSAKTEISLEYSVERLDVQVTTDKATSQVRVDQLHGGLTIKTTCVFIVGILAGSGFLALPKSLDNAGWIGIPLLFVFCFVSIYTSDILGKLLVIIRERGFIPTSGHVRYPYPAIGEAAFGKIGRYVVSATINFTNFGTVVVYILLAAENIERLLPASLSFSFCYISIIVAVVLIPVTWLGSPKEFWWTALGATLATFIASVIVLANTIKDRPEYPVLEHTSVDFVSFFTAFGTIAWAYNGHAVFPTVQADMREPKDFGKAAFIGYMLCLIIYIPSSVASYYIYGKYVDANILATLSPGPMKTIATVLMTLHLLLGIIIIINPVCQEMEHVLKIPNCFTWKRAITRMSVMVLALFVSESVPHFSAILALVGGSTVTLLGYIYPTVFYLKLCATNPSAGETWQPRRISLTTKVFNVELLVLGAVCVVAAVYSAMNDLINSSFSVPCYISIRSAKE